MILLENDLSTVTNPLAQTVRVFDTNYFVTKIGVFIKAKPVLTSPGVQNLPLIMEIRPVVNGYPSSNQIFANTRVIKYSADVTVSTDGVTNETVFELPVPLFVQEGDEFAVTLTTAAENKDNHKWQVWAARINNSDVNTGKTHASQPEAGVLFRSSNGTVWEPDQLWDLTFKVYRAKFDNVDAQAVFHPAEPAKERLENNPIQTIANDSDVYIYHPYHSFQVGQYARLYPTALFDSADSAAGIIGSQFFGYKKINFVDNNGYMFKTSTKANKTARYGSVGLLADTQHRIDEIAANVEFVNTPFSTSYIKGDFNSFKSYAAYSFEQENNVIATELALPNDDQFTFMKPYVLLTDYNEDSAIAGEKSVTINAIMTTEDQYEHSLIDIDRSRVVLIQNDIDYQDSTGAFDYFNIGSTTLPEGRNRTFKYVSEINATGSSSRARFITTPIALESPAKGLKIILDAHRPEEADFDVYYRTVAHQSADVSIEDNQWLPVSKDTPYSNYNDNAPSQRFQYREYRFTVGGAYGEALLPAFNQYQLKIVMKSRNTANVPLITNLRTIALAD